MKCSKAARCIGHAMSAEDREEECITACAELTPERHSQELAAFFVSRSLNQLEALVDDRINKPWNLLRRRLAATGNDNHNVELVFDSVVDTCANGCSDTFVSPLSNDKRSGRLRELRGLIAGPVVHN